MQDEPGPNMNTSNAELIVTPYDTESAGLEVVSSNLLTRPSASQWFEQWYLAVENKGSTVLCYIEVCASFRPEGISLGQKVVEVPFDTRTVVLCPGHARIAANSAVTSFQGLRELFGSGRRSFVPRRAPSEQALGDRSAGRRAGD